MKINYKHTTPRKFQQGGPMEAPMEGAPEEAPVGAEEQTPAEAPAEGEENPMMQIAQIFAQGLQNQDCQALAQGAQMFLQLIEQSQGGQPQEPQGEPVFARNGAKLLYRIK